MSKLHSTESGYVTLNNSRGEVKLCFNNIKLNLSLRALRQLKAHLQQIDPLVGMFNPEEKSFEVAFSSARFSLLFDYYEIYELEELVDEALGALELRCMLKNAGVELPRDLIS